MESKSHAVLFLMLFLLSGSAFGMTNNPYNGFCGPLLSGGSTISISTVLEEIAVVQTEQSEEIADGKLVSSKSEEELNKLSGRLIIGLRESVPAALTPEQRRQLLIRATDIFVAERKMSESEKKDFVELQYRFDFSGSLNTFTVSLVRDLRSRGLLKLLEYYDRERQALGVNIFSALPQHRNLDLLMTEVRAAKILGLAEQLRLKLPRTVENGLISGKFLAEIRDEVQPFVGITEIERQAFVDSILGFGNAVTMNLKFTEPESFFTRDFLVHLGPWRVPEFLEKLVKYFQSQRAH
jgi:hypothetical protein